MSDIFLLNIGPAMTRLLFLALCLLPLPSCSAPSPAPREVHYEGFFSPVFTADGQTVFYVKRETDGKVWGTGWEHFSPPAHARAAKDVFSLRKLDLASGEESIVRKWPPSPLVGREIRTYRNRIFSVPRVHLRFTENGFLEYEVSISIPTRPTSTTWTISRTSDRGGSDAWTGRVPVFSGYGEDRLRGSREVMAVPGEEAFPAAVVLVEHTDGVQKVLVAGRSYRRLYPEGVPAGVVTERSRKKEIERLRNMRDAHGKALQGFLDEGIPEGEARLLAIKEMQRLGYYPRAATITAVRLADTAAAADGDAPPLFTISETEFRVGLFRDIAEAIAAPGTAVEKGMGQYIRHRDFDTSGKINAFLKGGGTIFRVVHGGEVFELAVESPGREH